MGLSDHSMKRKDVERRLRDDGWIIDGSYGSNLTRWRSSSALMSRSERSTVTA